MNLGDMLTMAMNEIRAEKEQLEAGRDGYDDLVFPDADCVSDPVVLTNGRPDWVQTHDMIYISKNGPCKLAQDITDEEWDDFLAISVMNRDNNPYFAPYNEEDEKTSEDEDEVLQPHITIFNRIDVYGQTDLGIAAGMAYSKEQVEDIMAYPNYEIVQIFDMGEADSFFKQVKEIKKHFKELKASCNAE